MESKQKERNEAKAKNYMDSNIKIIQKIKSEESQKRINKFVSQIYIRG